MTEVEFTFGRVDSGHWWMGRGSPGPCKPYITCAEEEEGKKTRSSV